MKILICIIVIITICAGVFGVRKFLREIDAFDPLNRELFEAVAGDLLLDVGYSGHGDLEKVKSALKKGANVNFVNANGTTLLMVSEDKEIIKTLLDAGINVNAKDDFGNTALMLHINNPEIVKLILQANADVNIKDNKGNNALMRAAKKGEAQSLQLLLDTGKIKINDTNKRGQTAIMLASGFSTGRIIPTRLFYASEKGHLDCVRTLLNNKADINAVDKDGKTALIYAAQLVDTEQMYDPKIEENSATQAERIRFVSFNELSKPKSEQIQIVKLLLEKDAEVNHKDKAGKTALDYAIEAKSNIPADYKEIHALLDEIIPLLISSEVKE